MPYAPLPSHAPIPASASAAAPPKRTTRRRVLAVPMSMALLLSGVGVTGVVNTFVTTSSATASPTAMHSQVNQVRVKNKRAKLKWSAHLANVARAHAKRMAKQGKLYHNPNLAKDVKNFRRVGENVGYGPTSWSIEKAFVNSRGHRANILGRYTQVGIGQVRDSKGRLWAVQVFRA